jgi:ABC-type transport system involved in multi-copper enzyme maturation permease subunit
VTHGAVLTARKEIRALFPAWLACAGLLLAVYLRADAEFYGAALLAYGMGAIALGALSIGHEYAGRTLPLLLSQPVGRGRHLVVKLGAVAIMLLPLAAVAWAILLQPQTRPLDAGVGSYPVGSSEAAAMLATPLLAALFMAPVLTMVCRSPLAGLVFTVAIVSAVWGLAHVVAGARLGTGALRSDLDALTMSMLWGSVALLSIPTGMATWYAFMRLESVEGRGSDMHLPSWLGRPARSADRRLEARAVGQGAVWQLVKKELRIQQMTFVVCALYVVWCVAMWLLGPLVPELRLLPFDVIRVLYALLIALVAGSVASAEERQMGTLQWQVLLPCAVWKQWTVKAAIVFALALLLGIAVPAVFVALPSTIVGSRTNMPIAGAVILCAAIGLYVSSFSTSGTRALLLALPVGIGLVLGVAMAAFSLFGVLHRADLNVSRLVADALPAGSLAEYRPIWQSLMWIEDWLNTLFAMPFAALLLRFAFVNHRLAERSLERLARQAGAIAGTLLLGVALMFLLSEVMWGIMLRTRPVPAGITEQGKPPAARAQPGK